jgi:hypothetical protein
MNRKNLYPFLFFSFFILICSCGKEEPEVPDDLVFQSLVAEKDTIAPGETVKIKANASGSRMNYFWEATPFGDILGSGAEVTYAASPCGVGTNRISCRITNGKTQEDTKTIDVVVYE